MSTNFAPEVSILSLSKDAVLGQKRPFSSTVVLRQAVRKHPEYSAGQCGYVQEICPQIEMHVFEVPDT
jgi:hypothetical protein